MYEICTHIQRIHTHLRKEKQEKKKKKLHIRDEVRVEKMRETRRRKICCCRLNDGKDASGAQFIHINTNK